MMFFAVASAFLVIPLLVWIVNVFDSFIPVALLSTLRFKSSVLFGTHNLLDKLLIILQLPIVMDSNVIL